jgi:hypothetical protein
MTYACQKAIVAEAEGNDEWDANVEVQDIDLDVDPQGLVHAQREVAVNVLAVVNEAI